MACSRGITRTAAEKHNPGLVSSVAEEPPFQPTAAVLQQSVVSCVLQPTIRDHTFMQNGSKPLRQVPASTSTLTV
jgi:hypothetical protein